MNTVKSFDVIGLGAVTIDDFIYVQSYPPPDAKVPVLRSQRQCGGLTGTALVAASRLGARCAYAGVLGSDALSTHVIQAMEAEGIEMSSALIRPGVYPIHSTIVVDETRHTRNIFADLSGGSGADDSAPDPELLRSAKVLFVDHIGVPGMIRAAAICRSAAIPIVADFERDPGADFQQLLGLVDHLIISQDFARRFTGVSNAREAATCLWNDQRTVVVITCGSEGCWYLDSTGVRHQPAFPVATVDTTGCGDVFHGAYAAALAEGQSLANRIRFATAAAALKATERGGQLGIPRRNVLDAFLTNHST